MGEVMHTPFAGSLVQPLSANALNDGGDGGGVGGGGKSHCTLLGCVSAIPAHRNLFGVGGEAGKPLMTSGVAMHVMRLEAMVELIEGYKPRSCAMAPATWGHAIDVPDEISVAVSL